MHGHIHNLGKEANQAEAHDTHNQVRQQEANENGVHIGSLFHEQQGAGLETLHHEGAHHNGRSAIAGNSQGQHRNEGAAGNSIIASFRGANPLGLAVTEIAAVLGPALSLVIGDEGRDIAASAGHAAYESTDKGGTQQGHENPLDIRQGGQQAVDHHVLLAALVVIIFFNATQNLSKGKDANQNRNKGHAA